MPNFSKRFAEARQLMQALARQHKDGGCTMILDWHEWRDIDEVLHEYLGTNLGGSVAAQKLCDQFEAISMR